MRALAPRVLRDIRSHFLNALNGRGVASDTELREWISAIDGALRPKRGLAEARKERVAEKLERKDEWVAIRTAVLERAAGVCEACGKVDPLDLQADHMLGGNGRRVSLQSVFTVWALCSIDHRAKTNNRPDAAHWLRWFIRHAKNRMARAEDLGEANGYCAAADIAQHRLDALEMQGRATP